MPGHALERLRHHIRIDGTVKILEAEAHVLRLAHELHLGGWVRQTPQDLELEVEGCRDCLDAFYDRMRRDLSLDPTLPTGVLLEDVQPLGEETFEIVATGDAAETDSPFSPDMALCPECLKELFDPSDRRYRYPFTSCRRCGPRYSVTRKPPYTRACTTMAPFPMCPACRAEFEDPRSRRHQAQLISCPDCGPCYWIEPTPPPSPAADVIYEMAGLLKEGHILGVKGIGGFHLTCRARDEELVRRLRRRVGRSTKPFAVLVPHFDWARRLCHLNPSARGWLKDASAPIVLAPKRLPERLARSVAPDSPDYGLMLPSTPFRHLLMEAVGEPLVMTTANPQGEAIVADNDDARERLAEIADYLVLHDREIHMGCEDTVLRVQGDDVVTVRRSWGQAPRPLIVKQALPTLLGLGAIDPSTVAVSFDHRIVLSQHVGTLESPAALQTYRRTLDHLVGLFGLRPEAAAYDLHPRNPGRQVAQELGLRAFGVQHHLAHVAAVQVEHGLEGPVLGLGLDGFGWGPDGTLWGSEFLAVDGPSYQRLDHGPSFCLPGGESAVEHPWRAAAGLLWELRGPEAATEWMEGAVRDPDAVRTAVSMLQDEVGCRRTTGLGRLYDALAAILGILDAGSFEGQAPLSLERLAGEPRTIDISTLPDPDADGGEYFGAVVDHLLLCSQSGGDEVEVAAWAQKAVARWIARRAVRLSRENDLATVLAGGGCLINGWLRHELRDTCRSEGLRFFTNESIPPNDGGLAVGQIHVAAALLRRG